MGSHQIQDQFEIQVYAPHLEYLTKTILVCYLVDSCALHDGQV